MIIDYVLVGRELDDDGNVVDVDYGKKIACVYIIIIVKIFASVDNIVKL